MASLPTKGKLDFSGKKKPFVFPELESPKPSVLNPEEDFDGAPIARVSSVEVLKLDLKARLQELSPLSSPKNVKKEASALKISLGLLSEDATLSEERKQERIINLFSDAVKRLETKRKTPEGACYDRSPNLSNASKKPLVTITDNAQMLNYHYVWFAKSFKFDDMNPEMEEDILENFVLKYSFPICHASKDILTSEEKKAIVDNEYLFIKQKVEEKYPQIKFVQIPRLLYDLILIHSIKSHTFDQLFTGIEIDATDYTGLITKIGRKTRLNLETMFELNDLIHSYIYKKIRASSLLLDDFEKRRDLFITLFVSLFSDIEQGIIEGNLKFSLTPHSFKVKQNENFYTDDFNFDRFKTILFQSYLLDMGYMYDPSDDTYRVNNDTDKFILIRGDSGSWDAIWANKPVRRAHSSSYNTALMNAIYSDATAATLNYWRPTCNKKYYVIKKFIYGDDSESDKIFFIPPIHPILLLFSKGEFWHARTKVGKDFPKEPGVGGIFSKDDIEWGTVEKPLPDFLISTFTMDEIERTYVENYVDLPSALHVVHSEYNKYYNYKSKYLKYKNKYLELKNKLNF